MCSSRPAVASMRSKLMVVPMCWTARPVVTSLLVIRAIRGIHSSSMIVHRPPISGARWKVFSQATVRIVWGLTPADFSSILQTNGQGTAGFTGLTFGLAGPPDVNLTLAGYTETGITQTSQNTWTVAATNPSGMNSTLNISFGTTAPIDGLPSANYMQIQAM